MRTMGDLRALSLLLCSAAAVWAPAAYAQTADSSASTATTPDASSTNQPATLGEVVVTAQRRTETLNNVGLTVQAVGAQQIQKLGITDVQDLTKVVPAFTVSKAADGTPVYTMRGIGFNSQNLGAQPTVSVYMDEAGLPYGPLTQGPIYDLERVEVLKGPQGTLFGQNSTGGAINYIAAKPTEDFHYGANVTYGRFNTIQADGFISGPLAANLKGRLAATATDGGAWQYNYVGSGKHGKQKKYAGRALLEWTPIEALTVNLDLNGWVDKSDNQIPQFVAVEPRVPAHVLPGLLTQPQPPQDNRAADWDPSDDFKRDNKLGQAILRVDYRLGGGLTVTSLTNYAKAEVTSVYDNDGTHYVLGHITTDGFVKVFTQELRLAGDYDWGNFLVGANYQKDKSSELSLQDFGGTSSTVDISSPPLPPPGLGSIRQSENRGNQSNESRAVFGDVEWQLTDTLKAVGGARYTWAEHDDQNCTSDTGNGDWAHVVNGLIGLLTGTPGTVQPGECITLDETFHAPFLARSMTEHNLSWRAGLNYKPTSHTLVYGLISRGFKAGNYPIINAVARSSLRPVEQEELTSYEAGVKTDLGSFAHVNVAVYHYDYKNKQLLTQTLDPVFGLVPTLANVPTAKVNGFDADLIATPIAGLTVQGSVAYVDSKIGTFIDYDVNSNPTQLKGKSFNFAPKWMAKGDIEYKFPLGDLEGFVGGDVSYNSEAFADLAHSETLRIDPFTVVGLRAGVSSANDTWRVMAWGRNITDEYYWTNATLGFDTVYRNTGDPKTFGVTLSYKH